MSGSTTAPERRDARRFRLRVPMSVLDASDSPACRDLSEGGMFVETAIPRPVGVLLPLRLVHPQSGEVVQAVGQVVRHVVDEEGGLIGLGLRFANADESLGVRIRSLIRNLIDLDGAKELTDEPTPSPRLPEASLAPPSGEEDLLGDLNEILDERMALQRQELGPPQPDAAAGIEALRPLELETSNSSPLAVIEFDEAEVTWEVESNRGGDEDILVLEAVGHGMEPAVSPHSVLPCVWPDSVPTRIPGAMRHDLSSSQHRLLPFIDGNNTVEEMVRVADVTLEHALADLADMSRRAVIRVPSPAALQSERIPPEPAPESLAAPLFPGGEKRAEQNKKWLRARTLVTQGLAAERNDDLGNAVSLLEAALVIAPPNAADIHIRLALIGIHRLGNLDLAERHANAAKFGDPRARRLLRQIKRLRVKGLPAKPRPRPKKSARRPRPRNRRDPRGATMDRGRQLTGAALALAILGLLGWNLSAYIGPLMRGPIELEPTQVFDLVPALEVKLQEDKLVVTVSQAWRTLTAMEKTERLEKLATWARIHHRVEEVLIADSTPLLRARVRNREVTLFPSPDSGTGP